MSDEDWYLVPQTVIDRSKYRGKGRPRKEDYCLVNFVPYNPNKPNKPVKGIFCFEGIAIID